MNGFTKAFRLFSCTFFVASLIPVVANAQSAPSTQETVQQRQEAPQPKSPQAGLPSTGGPQASDAANAWPAAEQPQISFKDGRLSASFRNLPLGRLGEEISQKAGVAVVVSGDSGGQLVSGSFKDLPVDEGLREILHKQDVFFFYGVDEDKPSALKAVWIYPKGRGRGIAPVPPEKWDSTKELSAKLKDKDPKARARAIEALVERTGAAATDTLLQSVHDENGGVRSAALYAALRTGVQLPQTVLTNLALHDDSADVRFLALSELSNYDNPDVRSIAEGALKDPNEAVRSKAQEIVSQMNQQGGASQGPAAPAPVGGQPQDGQQLDLSQQPDLSRQQGQQPEQSQPAP